MAKSATNIEAQCAALIKDAASGRFLPVYLLMGDEPYYPDMVCTQILKHCIAEEDKDFNETICYGIDVSAEDVVTAARRFPMMSDRQLLVVKEAQLMKDIEALVAYCRAPLDSTVLVILLHKASVDKRKALYKEVQKIGVVVDSPAIRDYAIGNWITNYYKSRGLAIDPKAAILLGECAGTELSTVVGETEKLLKSLPEGTSSVSVEDVEKNVGISRQFSIFELTKALSARDKQISLKLASHIGNAARFNMPSAVSALYTHFSRILRYAALLSEHRAVSPDAKARALAGVNPYFYAEYDMAVRNYPLAKSMAAISLLCEYDYLGKGGDGGAAKASELLVELTAKLLNL